MDTLFEVNNEKSDLNLISRISRIKGVNIIVVLHGSPLALV